MPDPKRIAGVVLAGGRSSRMGQDKALLDFNGVPLIDHMTGLLGKAGINDIYVSGRTGETCATTNCRCLQDSAPFAGPAAAIRDVMERLSDYDGVLFVPVDMPFLDTDTLHALLSMPGGAHYKDWPLPLYLPTSETSGQGTSVRQMIAGMNVKTLSIPQIETDRFVNLNTPQEWKEAAGK